MRRTCVHRKLSPRRLLSTAAENCENICSCCLVVRTLSKLSFYVCFQCLHTNKSEFSLKRTVTNQISLVAWETNEIFHRHAHDQHFAAGQLQHVNYQRSLRKLFWQHYLHINGVYRRADRM